jgi:hypothetical protein
MATLELVPRGPVAYGRSGNMDYADDYRRKMIKWRDAARDEAINTVRLNPEFTDVGKYIDWIEGRQWREDRPKYRSRFFDNRVARLRVDSISLLTDIRPALEVTAAVQAYETQAKLCEAIVKHEWYRLNLDLEIGKVIDHALFSVGYWKIGALMPGVMTISPCGMDKVLPIMPGDSLQESVGVLYRGYKPIQYFRAKWGEKANGLEKYATSITWTNSSNEYVRPGHITEYTWNSLSPQMKRHLGMRSMRKQPQDRSPFPVIEHEEYWIDDPEINDSEVEVTVKDPDMSPSDHNYWYLVPAGGRLWPRKRLIVFGGDKIMYDGPSPYWHGLYPFAELILNPMVWAPGGLSKYRDMMPIAKALNEVGAGTLDVVKRAINPVVVTKEGAIRQQTFEQFQPDMPGGRLKMTPNSSVSQDLRYIDPPNIPAYVGTFHQYINQEFDRLSGTLDINKLSGKKQVPGGDTIEQMRDSMQTGFRLESRYMEPFLRDVGAQFISNIFQFYTRQQRMRILGADGLTWEDFDYDPDNMTPWSEPRYDHWKKFVIRVAPGSLHGGAKDRNKQVAIALFRLGAISRRHLLRTLDFPDGLIEKVEQELKTERESLPPMATGKGRVPRMTRSARNASPF